jgi:hypothetical protein
VGACAPAACGISAARRLVLEALYTGEGAVSADRVAGGLDGKLPPSDLASVYRNLETLEEAGLVQRTSTSATAPACALAGRHRGWACRDACEDVAARRGGAARIRDVVLEATALTPASPTSRSSASALTAPEDTMHIPDGYLSPARARPRRGDGSGVGDRRPARGRVVKTRYVPLVALGAACSFLVMMLQRRSRTGRPRTRSRRS